MIKVIAFDLVGVLVKEKNMSMTFEEQELERLFGSNISDNEYLDEAKKVISNNNIIKEKTMNILNNLYEIKDKDLLNNLKNKYPYIKLAVATNHLSKIRNFISKEFKNIDEIFISAEMNKVKPNKDFYEEIMKRFNCNSDEILFLDDNIENIKGADKCGFKTIYVDKNMNLFKEIIKIIDKETY